MERLQRSKSVRAIALASGLMLAACSSNSTEAKPKSESAPTVQNVEVDQKLAEARQKLSNDWHATAEAVTGKTNNPRAKEVMAMLNNSGLMIPYADGAFQIAEVPKKKGAPYAAPLLNSDANLGPKTDKLINQSHAAAVYKPETNSISVFERKVSNDWRGIIYLHEGNHALEFGTAPYDWQDPRTFAQHELSTHKFENQLIASLGGEAYQKHVNNYAQELKSKIVVKESGFAMAARDEYSAELDTIFGPAQSDFEKDLRATHVWIDASLRALDLQYGITASPAKQLDFMTDLYVRNGITGGGK